MVFRPNYAIPSSDTQDPAVVQEVTGTVAIEGDINVDFPPSLVVSNLPVIQVVSGSVAVTNPTDVSGLLTNAQLRGTPVPTLVMNTLVPAAYDYVDLGYTGADLTGVVFKVGGSGGTTVRTLVLTYAGGVLDTVTAT